MDQPDTKIGLATAAKLLNVSKITLQRWIRSGKLPAPEYSLAGSPRFLEAAILKLRSTIGTSAKSHTRSLGEESLVTLTRAAEICKISLFQMRNWRRAGRFPEPKVSASGELLFVEREIVEFAKRRAKRLLLDHLLSLDSSDTSRTVGIRKIREKKR